MDTFDNAFSPNALSATTDRWTPLQDGEIFCSPACGAKCTKAEYDHAVTAANALVAMIGPGWETEVWENLGWHYRAKKGSGEICYEGNKFEAIIQIEPDVAITRSASHPRQALERAIAVLDEKIGKLTRARSSLALMPLEINDCASGN